MNYIKHRYGNPPVFITENGKIKHTSLNLLRQEREFVMMIYFVYFVGMDDPNNFLISRKEALKDTKRIRYHHDYLSSLQASIKEDGCKVKGYFVWSLLDNWEWAAGYSSRFGLYFVDYRDNLKRYPKDSVHWFTSFLNSTS